MHWKWYPPILAAIIAVAAWATFSAGLVLDFSRATMIGIAFVGAFALEGIVWTLAAALGISVFQARARIFEGLTAFYRRKA